MTAFSIRAFTGEDAEAVGTWRYPPPYGVYDLREDPEQDDDMRTAALFAKAVEADASAMRAEDVLLAGTARGGEILGLPVGRIAPDHAADLVVVDLEALSVQPPATAHKQIVYSMQPDAIARVIVGGETVVERGRLTKVDEAEIVARVAETTEGWTPPEET